MANTLGATKVAISSPPRKICVLVQRHNVDRRGSAGRPVSARQPLAVTSCKFVQSVACQSNSQWHFHGVMVPRPIWIPSYNPNWLDLADLRCFRCVLVSPAQVTAQLTRSQLPECADSACWRSKVWVMDCILLISLASLGNSLGRLLHGEDVIVIPAKNQPVRSCLRL